MRDGLDVLLRYAEAPYSGTGLRVLKARERRAHLDQEAGWQRQPFLDTRQKGGGKSQSTLLEAAPSGIAATRLGG